LKPYLAFIILPGKNHINWYICSGTDPRPVWSGPVKRNNQTLVIFFLTIACWIVTVVRIIILKRKTGNSLPTISSIVSQNATFKTLLDKQSLASFATILVSLGFYIPAAVVVVGLNRILTPEDLVSYPNYLFLHFLNHQGIFLWNVYMITIHFYQSKSMRETVWRQMKQVCSDFVENVKTFI